MERVSFHPPAAQNIVPSTILNAFNKDTLLQIRKPHPKGLTPGHGRRSVMAPQNACTLKIETEPWFLVEVTAMSVHSKFEADSVPKKNRLKPTTNGMNSHQLQELKCKINIHQECWMHYSE